MAETILVTGGAGYIGSHIVVELAAAGYAPIDRRQLRNSSPTVLPRLRHLTAQAVPCVDGRRARSRGADAIVCRARDRGGRSLRGTEGRRRKRAAAGRLLRQQRRRRDRARRSDGRSGREDAGLQLIGDGLRSTGPQSGGRRRAAATRERLWPHQAASSSRFSKMSRRRIRDGASALLRYFNPAGAHPSARDRRGAVAAPEQPGADCSRKSRLRIGAELSSLRRRLADTPDGTGVRDYIHVMDLADGPRRCAGAPAPRTRRDNAQSRRRSRLLGAGSRRGVRARLRRPIARRIVAATRRRHRDLLRRPEPRASPARVARDAATSMRSVPMHGAGSSVATESTTPNSGPGSLILPPWNASIPRTTASTPICVLHRLQQAGIAAHIFNEHMSSIVGEVPPDVAQPQVWIEDARDRPRANAALAALRLRSGSDRKCLLPRMQGGEPCQLRLVLALRKRLAQR